LAMGGELSSDRGCFRLVMQSDGNLVLYRNGDDKAIWNSNTVYRMRPKNLD
jgi:hypothetical protein